MIALRPDDACYPRALRDLERPPDPLWVEGIVAALAQPAVAIVGTRRMTGYGERVAREISLACAAAGIVVVSGLAQGIDSASHRGALDGGGRTVAVLGESIASFRAHVRGRRRPLVPRIVACGALVSEFAAPFTAQRWTFAQRDATIAALATAVVVVEAGERSGALITAEDARRLGRALFAVPGPLGSVASVGTNALIANGFARALLAPDQLIRAIGVTQAADSAVTSGASSDPLLDALRDGPLGLDEIARRSRVPVVELRSRIALLLVSGRLAPVGDGRFRRT
jgi:DNA processing protein